MWWVNHFCHSEDYPCALVCRNLNKIKKVADSTGKDKLQISTHIIYERIDSVDGKCKIEVLAVGFDEVVEVQIRITKRYNY